jgi:hypothetical protein
LTITGYGVRNGNNKAFVATVPEPGALAALALTTGALTARWRRRRAGNEK